MKEDKEIELQIIQIVNKGQVAGVHLILSTQRPTCDIITSAIKANIMTRISFRLPEKADSQVILDCNGAEELLGNGDMLYKSGNSIECVRIQGAYIETSEIERIIQFIAGQQGYTTVHILPEPNSDPDENAEGGGTVVDMHQLDPLFYECAELVVATGQGSTSMIQRKFGIGYHRAEHIMDQMEAAGIVGPYLGSKAREVLIDGFQQLTKPLGRLL